MLRPMIEVARREFWENIRRPGYIIITLVYPLVLFSMLLLPSQLMVQFATEATIGVVDEVGGLYGTLRKATSGMDVVPFNNTKEADAALDGQKIRGYLIIHNVSTGTYVTTSQNPAELFNVRAAFEAVVLSRRLRNEGLDTAAQARVLARVSFNHNVKSETGVKEGNILTFLIAYMIPILFIVPLFLTGQYLVQSVAEEKENRVVELILSSPITPSSLLMGKVLGLCVLGLIQMTIWFGGASFALASTTVQITASTIALSLLFFLLGYLFYGMVLAGLGAMGSSLRESQYISMTVSWFALVPFILLPALQENVALARLLALFPFFTPVVMIIRIFSHPPSIGEVFLYSLVLLISTVIASRVFGRIFRATILMYGTRPTLRHLWRALTV